MKKGLTILELIIAVATIVLIATIAPLLWRRYASESHDIRRVGAVAELQGALKSYFMSHGTYPVVEAPEAVTLESKMLAALINDFFIARTHPPVDPESPLYDFIYQSDGKSFVLTFCQIQFAQPGYVQGCSNKIYPLAI